MGDIFLEKLSDTVAYGADGNYYYYTGGNWYVATESGGVISYNGQPKLTITTGQGVDEFGNPITITYYELHEQHLIIGSDGSVVWTQAPQEAAKTAEVAGTTYQIGYIGGYDVTITMQDDAGTLNDWGGTDEIDIEAANDLTIQSNSSGSLGTQFNPLDLKVGGTLYLRALDGTLGVFTDTYLFVKEGNGGLYIADGTVVDGVDFVVIVENGDITGGSLRAINGAYVHFIADGATSTDGNILFDGDITVTDSELECMANAGISMWNLTATNSTVTITALHGGIGLYDLLATDSTVDLSAYDDITLWDFTCIDSIATLTSSHGDILMHNLWADPSTVTFTAYGYIYLYDLTSIESTVTITSQNASIYLYELDATDSTVTLTAYEDIELLDLSSDDSGVALTAQNGSIQLEDLLAESDSVVDLRAGGNITMLDLTASDSDVSLDAGASILAHAVNVLRSTLYMRARTDIGLHGFDADASTVTLIALEGSISLYDLGRSGGQRGTDDGAWQYRTA